MRKIRVRKSEVEVKGCIIIYDEQYVVNEDGEEVFDREIEIQNDINLFNEYRKLKGLLTTYEIKNIREKYKLNQKEFAKVLGLGEVSINRFENGSIQTEAIDAIIRLAKEPQNMKVLINKNREYISKELYIRLDDLVQQLIDLKQHALIDLNNLNNENNELKTVSVDVVADCIIGMYNKQKENVATQFEVDVEYITNLKLQKLLYYVQAFSLLAYDTPAFDEKIVAWAYGPVVEKIYTKYKNGKESIKEIKEVTGISSTLKELINAVINTYGNIEATKLIELTHKETPWKNTDINTEIKKEDIQNYFKKIYGIE